MTQTRKASLLEACLSTAIGFAISYLVLTVIAWVWELDTSAGDNFLITCIFTVTSIIRQYYVRRLFNWMGARP